MPAETPYFSMQMYSAVHYFRICVLCCHFKKKTLQESWVVAVLCIHCGILNILNSLTLLNMSAAILSSRIFVGI